MTVQDGTGKTFRWPKDSGSRVTRDRSYMTNHQATTEAAVQQQIQFRDHHLQICMARQRHVGPDGVAEREDPYAEELMNNADVQASDSALRF